MGDRTYIQVYVKAPDAYIPAILDALQGADMGAEDYDKQVDGVWRITEQEIYVGSEEGVAEALIKLMDEGGERYNLKPCKFAFRLWTDPKYEYLGGLELAVPDGNGGLLELAADCDADGRPFIDGKRLVEITRTSATLEEARERIAKITGAGVLDAWEAYQFTAKDEDLARPCETCNGTGIDENYQPEDPDALVCATCDGKKTGTIPVYDEKTGELRYYDDYAQAWRKIAD